MGLPERQSVLSRIHTSIQRVILDQVPPLSRSVAVQSCAWVGLLSLGLLAGRGPLLSGWLVAALVLLLIAAAVGVLATNDQSAPMWAPAALVAWPVMAPSVAAALDAPGARMVVMSMPPVTAALAVWWLTLIGSVRRWVAVMSTLTVVGAVIADLTFRDPYREQYCHPLCAPNPWVTAHRPAITSSMQWLVAATVGVAIAMSVRAAIVARPPAWRACMTAAILSLAALVGVAGVRRLRSAPGSGIAAAWSAVELLAIALAVVAALTPVAGELMGRRRVGQWVDGIEGATAAGGVIGMLRHELGDPTLRLVGATDEASRDDGRATTGFWRGGRVVAVVEHRPESTDRLRALATSPVVAALENDALVATAHTQLAELRSARRSVVERGDAATRRLQRDLHDGAQQRLIVLGLELSALADRSAGPQRARLEQAALDAGAALTGLRHIAHRDLPPVLDEQGLAEALTSFAEDTSVPIGLHIGALVGRRFAPDIERAAFRFVTASADLVMTDGRALTVTAEIDRAGASELVVTTVASGAGIDDRTADEDRVGAAGGLLRAWIEGGAVRYEARFPCA